MARTIKDPTRAQLPQPQGSRYKSRPARWTEEEVERGLVALALVGGNANKASKTLAPDLKVSASALYNWKKRHAERYEQVQAEVLPKLRAALMPKHIELAERQLATTHTLMDSLAADLEAGNLEPRDKVNYLGKIDIGSGIHTDHAYKHAAGQAPAPKESITELFRALAQFKGIISFTHPLADVEGTAEDITPEAKSLPEGQPEVGDRPEDNYT